MRRVVLCAVLLLLTACPPPRATRRPLPPLAVDAYAHYLRGRAAFFEGDYELAVPELERAMPASSGAAAIAIAHAEALARLGRRVDAGAAIDAVVARFPRSPEAWLAAGALRTRAGAADAAMVAYRRALALDPALAEGYLGLASAQIQAGQRDRAERTYALLVARLPELAEGHWRLAQVALARGDDATAGPALLRVRDLSPDDVDARRALAALLARRGDLATAIAEARVAFDRSGGDLAVAEDLVWLLLEAGDRRGALDLLGSYDDAPSPDDLVRVAAMAGGLGATDLALRFAGQARARGVAVGALIAQLHLARGELDLAIAAADAVPATADERAAAQAVAAWAELAYGPTRREALVQRLARARAAAADSVELIEVDAEQRRRSGDVAGGRALWTEAARARPRDIAVALGWSSYERRAGDRARALALAEKVLAATPDEPGVQSLVGFLIVEGGGDLERAGRLLLAARRRAPGDAGILDSWGWLRRAVGDLDGAARALDRATLIAPLDPEIGDHAARVSAERGLGARAGARWATLLALPMAPALAAQVRDQLARTGVAPCYAAEVMKQSWLVRLAVGTFLATAACEATPSKSDCEKLLAHLIDIEVTSGGGDKLPPTMKGELDKQKAAIRDYAVGQKFISTCSEKTPKKVVSCGLAAKNADELAKCDQ